MDVIKFIEKDVERGKRRSWLIMIALLLATALFPVLFGIFLRDDLNGVFEARIFIPNLMAAILLGLFPLFYARRNQISKWVFPLIALTLGFSLFLAIDRIFFPPAIRTVYASDESFRHETLLCFRKGAFSASVMGIWLCYFAFMISSWPSRRYRFLLSAVAGISSAVMLGFHCDSSSVSHVLVGHIAPGIVMGLMVYFAQEMVFVRGIRKAFPGLSDKIARIRKIG